MELTQIGAVTALIGLYVVMFGTVRSAVYFIVISAIMQGSAAISLPSLGGATIPVGHFAMVFALLKIFTPKGGYHGLFPAAVRDHRWLVMFVFYGVAMAYLGPRLLAGDVMLFPMQPTPGLGDFETVPLAPSAQNVTGALFMVGALLLGLIGYIFSRVPGAQKAFIGAILFAGWLHAITGVVDIATRGTPMAEILNSFRNVNHNLLDHSTDGFIRIRGTLAEASVYAAQGFILFVVSAEMWYRSIRPRATGALAGALALILVISTASTAYVSLAVYGIFFVVRATLFPSVAPKGKMMRAAILGFAILCILSATFAVVPQVLLGIWNLVADMTLDKPQSFSGQQRLFWAQQGWNAFLGSYGLGVGPGSFRSSSIVTAILGSVGVFGTIAFLLHFKRVFMAARRSTWGIGPTPQETLGGAFGTAAILGLTPAIVNAPHASPSELISIIAGASIALRAFALQSDGAAAREAVTHRAASRTAGQRPTQPPPRFSREPIARARRT
ncbi:glycoside hydrolase [Qipengyuania sp. G39]|uniref:Glycoside hydrolase n=1 Tax=Qipengyuania profundimaris TaxID=3067652 RepID=A0ABT9HP76_9SPHN|nr:glycoside hydrolase [Qipengyuania sp. G39]MDP4574932.1 glycoside hydrolase [Qipengyuania sp. G39]